MCGEDTTNHNFFGSLMPLFSVDETISRTESRGWKKPKLLKWWLQFQWAQLQKKGGGGIRKVLSLSFGTCLHLQINWNLHVEYNTIATLGFNTSNLSFSLAFCLHCDLADFFPLIFHVHYVKKESRCEGGRLIRCQQKHAAEVATLDSFYLRENEYVPVVDFGDESFSSRADICSGFISISSHHLMQSNHSEIQINSSRSLTVSLTCW